MDERAYCSQTYLWLVLLQQTVSTHKTQGDCFCRPILFL